jgi:hypothetical protein
MLNPNRSRKIIVNADDFGMSAEVNRAMVEAFHKGAISSATLITNMPGFAEACELAHRHRLLGKIGLGLNLTSGYPLSAPIRRCSRFCDEVPYFGADELGFVYRRKRDSPWKRRSRHRSGPASIVDCIRRTWIHTITSTQSGLLEQQPSLWRAGMGYGRSDCHATAALGSIFARRCYRAYNTRLRIYGLTKTRSFGSSADVQEILAAGSGDVELMVHLNSESTGSISDGRGHIEIERWFSTHQLVIHASQGIGCYRAVYK